MLLSCGTKDAEAEYASAVQWSSSSRVVFWGGVVDILYFFGVCLGWSVVFFNLLVPFFFFFFLGVAKFIYISRK